MVLVLPVNEMELVLSQIFMDKDGLLDFVSVPYSLMDYLFVNLVETYEVLEPRSHLPIVVSVGDLIVGAQKIA